MKVERTGFTWGAAISAMVVGLLLLTIGANVGSRALGQATALIARYQQSPAAMLEQELPRMHKVNANFEMTLTTFGIAAALGLVLIYAVRSDAAHGVGSALILIAGLGFLIDGFASRRAATYTAALKALVQTDPSAGR